MSSSSIDSNVTSTTTHTTDIGSVVTLVTVMPNAQSGMPNAMRTGHRAGCLGKSLLAEGDTEMAA